MNNEKISRKDFLKVGILGVLGTALLAKSTVLQPEAIVRDNKSGGANGVKIGNDAPANKGYLWIDTSAGGRGVVKYWNGSAWQQTASVWDE